MRLTVLSAAQIRAALPMPQAIEAMKAAFADFSSGRADAPQRLSIDVAPAGGTLLVKPAFVEPAALGAKLVSVFPGNLRQGLPLIHGLVVLIDPATGIPTALLDGTFLTAWRTGAASGAATDLLARDDARTAALIGCGVQGRTQLLAIDAVRELERVWICARSAAAAERFVGELQPAVRARLAPTTDADAAVAQADVVCAATSSPTPVFDGRRVRPGCHVNGVGSFTPKMQEVDAHLVRGSRVFVDSVRSALAEAGDLIIPLQAGDTDEADWTELGQVAEGSRPGRRNDSEITFFKSVGLAVQDVVAAARAVERAAAASIGSTVEL